MSGLNYAKYDRSVAVAPRVHDGARQYWTSYFGNVKPLRAAAATIVTSTTTPMILTDDGNTYREYHAPFAEGCEIGA